MASNRILDRLKSSPLLRPVQRRRRVSHFFSSAGVTSCYGVFDSFVQTRLWLPPSKEFDQRVLTDEYVQIRMKRTYAYDYPVVHWLNEAFADGARRVWDVGGSVGVHHYAYKSKLRFP